MTASNQNRKAITSHMNLWVLGSLCILASAALQAQSTSTEAVSPKENRLVLPAHYRSELKTSDFFILEFVVTEQGLVEAPVVIATTRPELKKEVLSGVESWKFEESNQSVRVRQRIMLK
ncbi:MAG: hypothetical protein ACPGN3_14150 [Opitutales bacterium]